MLKIVSSMFMVGVLTLSGVAVASPVQAKAASFKDCSAMYKKYAYGVKLKGAKDKVNKTTFSPVTNTTQVSTAVYNASKKLDYDKDKVICERPKYKNCSKLNAKYKHGMGIKGAKDKVTGNTKKVNNYTVVTWQFYNTNSHLDREKDRIACEKI